MENISLEDKVSTLCMAHQHMVCQNLLEVVQVSLTHQDHVGYRILLDHSMRFPTANQVNDVCLGSLQARNLRQCGQLHDHGTKAFLHSDHLGSNSLCIVPVR